MTHIAMILRAAVKQTCSAVIAAVLLTGLCLSQPSITLTPKSGPPTGDVGVSGNGFAADAVIDVYFDGTEETVAVANGSGSFSKIVFPVPSSATPGVHWVSAVENSTDIGAQAEFLVETNWAQFGFTAQDKRNNPYENVVNPSNVGSLDLLWSYTTGGAVESSPAVADGVVYIGSDDGNLYALDAATGALKWSYYTSGAVLSSPAVANGLIYVGTSGGSLLALTQAGQLKWSFQTGSSCGYNYPATSPVVAGSAVYFVAGCPAGAESPVDYLIALNAETGTQMWNNPLGDISPAPLVPAVFNNLAYVTIPGQNCVYSFQVASGADSSYYCLHVPPLVFSNTLTIGDGFAFAGLQGINYPVLYAFKAVNLNYQWTYQSSDQSEGAVPNCCAVAGNSVFYNTYILNSDFTAVTTTVVGLTIEGGEPIPLWTFNTNYYGSEVFSTPAAANGVVYVSSNDSYIYAFDAATGTGLWSFPTGAAIDSSPVVANGAVYVGSQDWNVYAFGLNGGQQAQHIERPALSSLHPGLSLKLSQPTTTTPGRH